MQEITVKVFQIALVDDEPSARAVARELLIESFPEVRIVGEAGGVQEGFELLNRTRPDLVLLDIDMPDGTGFDLLSRWDNPPFKVIFITAFDQFAIKAFQFSAFDYLLKPLDPLMLLNDVQKLIGAISQPSLIPAIQLQTLLASIQRGHADRLLIPHQTGFHAVPLDELLFIQSEGSYSYIYSKNNLKILSSRPIAQYEQLLPPETFQRVHQSYLLNLREVRSFEQGDDMEATLSSSHKVPISRRKKQEFIEAMKRMSLG
ncbi:MAG: response regulator transcription factor [Saprospiraceae bacterium]|nr:response regulator transcription factor [Saprospiraceae bacterium]